MFAGIVEAKARILDYTSDDPKNPQTARLIVEKPINFNDLRDGDSIAVNGICLTVEAFDERQIQFALGPETLRVTGWSSHGALPSKSLNLERSVRLGDRVHGHFVTGHADGLARIFEAEPRGEALELTLVLPSELAPLVWAKGSIALNGVSLTVNTVYSGERGGTDCFVEVGLIPETLKRTNLAEVKAGDTVIVEVDQFARGLLRRIELDRSMERERSASELHT